MMTMRKDLSILALIILMVFSLSCNRDANLWDGELITSVDQSFADGEFAAISHLFDLYGRSDSLVYGETPITGGFYCPGASTTIPSSSSSFVRVEFDFGNGTNCLDGRNRAGKLVGEYSGKWTDPGSTISISPDGYSVAGYAFFFNLTTTLNQPDANGNPNWTTVITNAELINPSDGGRINWESTRTTTWIEGEDTFTYDDNAYEVTGSATGNARSLRFFTAETTTPLRYNVTCPQPVSGVVSISPDSLQTRSINYGAGTCDNFGVIQVNGFEQQFNLR